MINFKDLLSTVKTKATSPTAFSWYGIVGVAATGVLTFVSTTKWMKWEMGSKDNVTESSTVPKKFKELSLKEKIKEIIGTAVIFTPPVLAAFGTSWCIRRGNAKALESVGSLEQIINNQSARLDKYKGFAVGALASELRDKKPEDKNQVLNKPHHLYFSDDDLQHEDYGNEMIFYIEGVNSDDGDRMWFKSTMLEVLMAEYAFNKFLWNDRNGEFASLNELLTMFGADKVSYGDGDGWSKEAGFDNGYDWVGFTHKKIYFDDGTYGYLIIFDSEPTFDEIYEWFISES